MTGAERGFLLLSSHLGDAARHPLTTAQLRTLARRMQSAERPDEDRELAPADLMALGYDRKMAEQITLLLSQERLLNDYLKQAENCGCMPITRVSNDYPLLLRKRLGAYAWRIATLRGVGYRFERE